MVSCSVLFVIVHTYIDKLRVSGGAGKEAIEIGLQRINQIIEKNEKNNIANDISSILIIGDAPATPSLNDVKKRRDANKTINWNKSKYFQTPTYFKDEMLT